MFTSSGFRSFADKTFANRTFAIGESPLYFRQYTLSNFANWRMSTVLSPIYPLEFRQLTKVHSTFANIPAGISPIWLWIRRGLEKFLVIKLVRISYGICEDPLYSRKKQTSNTKHVCMHTTTQTHKKQHNISAASNAFSHAYIASQHTLSCSKSMTSNQTCERREKERKRMKRMWEECEWKETYMREKRMYHGRWPCQYIYSNKLMREPHQLTPTIPANSLSVSRTRWD
jgi:hypothetical protein